MPELSDQQRRKLMALEPHYAEARLVDLFMGAKQTLLVIGLLLRV